MDNIVDDLKSYGVNVDHITDQNLSSFTSLLAQVDISNERLDRMTSVRDDLFGLLWQMIKTFESNSLGQLDKHLIEQCYKYCEENGLS